MTNKIDFICIGPGKSGTSWMYKIFSEHPDICISTSKETLYFERYLSKGDDWYHSFFKKAEEGQIKGELSNTYIFDSKVPARIHAYKPNIKLISSLRNPIDRTFSHYLYLLSLGEVEGSFEEVLAKRKDLYDRGEYFKLIQHYDKFFSKEQFLILIFEDLKKDSVAFADKIFTFLGVDNKVSEEIIKKKVLGARKSRNPVFSRLISKGAHLAREWDMAGLVTKIKFNRNITKYLYKDFKPNEKPTINPETRKDLAAYFYADTALLSERLGIDLIKLWKFDQQA